MKKKQPFIEIIDLNEEYKDYKDLCNNNSKKYTYYDDWKKYMIGKFKTLPKEHFNNFKHFLMFHSFVGEQSGNVFLSTVLVAVTIIVSTKYSDIAILNTIATIIAVLLAAIMIITSYFDLMRNDRFVKDVLEIFEEYAEAESKSETEAKPVENSGENVNDSAAVL